ncbi:hypothetical protein [Bdellovibrio sp. HCB288]|uniref:hypothetical protein n=1 Tax=Bdellovibrio sp. HCB288 TaxID=3394355 RepID=UPI0039B5244F
MKQILLLFTGTFISTSCFASGVLLQAPGSSPEEFTTYLKSHPAAISHSQFQSEKLKSNPRQDEDLYRIGDNMEVPAKVLAEKFQTIEDGGPLSVTATNFVFDLTSRLLERPELQNNVQLKTLNCKVRGLLGIPLEKCRKVQVDFQAIARQWSFASVLMIESAAFTLSAINHLEISKEAIYQFALISDTHKTVTFKGTYDQFMQQNFSAETLVNGDCQSFSSNIDDFQILNSGSVYFNNDCIKSASSPKNTSGFGEWIEKNKTWVYPVGIILIGSAGAYALKDKTLVITKP